MQFEWDETKNIENIRKCEIEVADIPAMNKKQHNPNSFPQEELPIMNRENLNSTSRTDLAALVAMSDKDIDYSDIPPLTDEFFERATLCIPVDKAHNLVQLDPDVQQWFQDQGDQYTTLINSVLRQYIEEKANADRPKPL